MVEFLKSLSKHTLALLILVVGVLFVVLSDPPVTVCKTQAEAFNKDMSGVLTPDPKQPLLPKPKFQSLIDICKSSNSVGGCFPLFAVMKQVLDRTKLISVECRPNLGDIGIFKSFISESIKLMTRLAWGEKPPESAFSKNGYLETGDLALYCRLQKEYISFYGEGAWSGLREDIMRGLPKAKELKREDVWARSILSINCSAY